MVLLRDDRGCHDAAHPASGTGLSETTIPAQQGRAGGLWAPAVVLLLVNAVATVSGFLREMVIAKRFGTTAAADAFALVIFFLDTLQSVGIVGIATYILIPFVARDHAANRSDTTDAAIGRVVAIGVVAVAAIALLFVVFPHAVVSAVLSGGSTEAAAAADRLLRYSAPAIPLIFAAGLASTILQGRSHFSAPSLARLVLNVFVAAGLAFLVPALGLAGGALAFVIAGLAQLVFVILMFRRANYRLDLSSPAKGRVSEILMLGIPALFSFVLSTMGLGAGERYFASTVGQGSVAVQSYAFKLYFLFLGWGISLQAVSFTRLSERSAGSEGAGDLMDPILTALRAGIYTLLPVAMAAWLLREPLVSVAFERGQFGAESLRATASMFGWYLTSIVPAFAIGIVIRSHFALGLSRAAVITTVVWVGASLGFDALATRTLGLRAIPIGFAIGCAAGTVYGLYALEARLRRRAIVPLASFCLLVATLGAGALIPVLAYREYADLSARRGGLPALVIGGMIAMVSAALFMAVSLRLNLREALFLRSIGARRANQAAG